MTWWPNKIITLRPELRFDHSHDTAAFNNGTETSLSDQWTSSFTTNDPDEG